MTMELERNLGEQPIARVMADNALAPRDLVAISTQHLTFKMVSRACKGRRLTPNIKSKIREAVNTATAKTYAMEDLFTY